MTQGRLIRALAVSYADRLAAFVMPLLMLRGSSGEDVYIKIEFIITISVFVATFADAGLRNYVLYHFGRTRDVVQTTLLTARAGIFIFVAQILLLAVIMLALQVAFAPESSSSDLWLGVVRGIGLSIIGVTTQILIIHDRPLAGVLLSLTSWLIGATALLLPTGTSVQTTVAVFFAASFVTVLSVPFVLCRISGFRLTAEGLDYLKSSVSWGWPLLIGAAASIAIAGFTRIYGILTFSIATASALVFWMRIFSIIQLSHRAAITIVSRRIYLDDEKTVFSAQVLRTYFQMVLPAAALAFALGFCSPLASTFFGLHLPQLGPEIIIMIGLQVTLWSLAALMEMPLTRQGRVFSVLWASLIPSALFIVFLVAAPAMKLGLLTVAMMLASALQLTILCVLNFWWVRIKHA